ncbi:unnamed protein product, partial [marine sediment metagenome]
KPGCTRCFYMYTLIMLSDQITHDRVNRELITS